MASSAAQVFEERVVVVTECSETVALEIDESTGPIRERHEVDCPARRTRCEFSMPEFTGCWI